MSYHTQTSSWNNFVTCTSLTHRSSLGSMNGSCQVKQYHHWLIYSQQPQGLWRRFKRLKCMTQAGPQDCTSTKLMIPWALHPIPSPFKRTVLKNGMPRSPPPPYILGHNCIGGFWGYRCLKALTTEAQELPMFCTRLSHLHLPVQEGQRIHSAN